MRRKRETSVARWARGRGAQVVEGSLPEGYVPPSGSLTPPRPDAATLREQVAALADGWDLTARQLAREAEKWGSELAATYKRGQEDGLSTAASDLRAVLAEHGLVDREGQR